MCAISPKDRIEITEGIQSYDVEFFDSEISGIIREYPLIAAVLERLLKREAGLDQEERIESTHKHCIDVAKLAKILVENSELPQFKDLGMARKEILMISSLLHDVGKGQIDLDLLLKKGKLTEAEWVEFKNHPVAGRDLCLKMLGDHPYAREIAEIVLRHHAYKKKNPYPEQEAFSQDFDPETESMIRHFAKTLAIIDAFDSLRSERSYRHPENNHRAIIETLLAEFGQEEEELINYLVNNFTP
jgi:HD-GYP domain-containing protein (c-di-GMP phosphodiesterase class II)